MSLRLTAVAAVATVLLAMGGIIYVQSQRLESTLRRLDETTEVLDATRRAVAEMERNAAMKAARDTIVSTSREAIIAAPPEDDAPISPVLMQGLRAADQIGGFE